MADLHETFIDFNDNIIKLSPTRKKELRAERDKVREDIKKYFKENRDKHSVGSKGQGSFMMNTTILPLDDEYDIDDGVYIFGTAEDKPTTETAHSWILAALKERTLKDKNTCVRVICGGDYHIDLPIYYKLKNSGSENIRDEEDIPQLAHKAEDWLQSDPYEFFVWFRTESKDKPQLKRIIRYLKAWTDNKSSDSLRLPSGMVFTILATNNFVESDKRDDKSLLKTLEAIQEKIDDTRFNTASYVCKRPTVDKKENLLNKYSADTTKTNFLNSLNSFIVSGRQAIAKASKKEACSKWQKHLGDRFPCNSIVESDEDIAIAFPTSDKIKHDNKSAL